MLSNVGHTIQKMLNNTPVSVSANETSTSVITSGGSVYQAGLVNDRVQNSFNEILANTNIPGIVVDGKSTSEGSYFLTSTGSVYQYNSNNCEGNPQVREIYSPAANNGEKAINLVSGSSHVVMLTDSNRVFGAGSNKYYQLVPQGQSRYDYAVELVVSDINNHDNNSTPQFTGVLGTVTASQPTTTCGKVTCTKNNLQSAAVGQLSIPNVTITPTSGTALGPGTLNVPVTANLVYNGFLCVGSNNVADGNVTFTTNSPQVLAGAENATLLVGSTSTPVNVVFDQNLTMAGSLVDNAAVSVMCGATTTVSLPTATAGTNTGVRNNTTGEPVGQLHFSKTFTTTTGTSQTSTAVLSVPNSTISTTATTATSTLSYNLTLNCCGSGPTLAQPTWVNVYAGSNTTVLADSSNKLYTLGSIYQVRNNKNLLNNSCIDQLLAGTTATVSLPADQLPCTNVNTGAKSSPDFSKFGVQLSFANGYNVQDNGNGSSVSLVNTTNVCDFLKALKDCSANNNCNSTCNNDDSYVYLDVANTSNSAASGTAATISSVTLLNMNSVACAVSGNTTVVNVNATTSSIVEFDLTTYNVDGQNYPLSNQLVLNFGTSGVNVNLYLDVGQPGGVLFTPNNNACNVQFTADASTPSGNQFIMNYGSLLDPVALTNLKVLFSLNASFPSPRSNSSSTGKIRNTYLTGGDSVSFVTHGNASIRQSVTPDVPTVFRLARRAIDVAVGHNNISVLTGGIASSNEVFAIGANCNGQLGIGSYETPVTWQQVNKCLFDRPVRSIFAGDHVTLYVTQCNSVFASGKWKSLVNSNVPVQISTMSNSWKVKNVAISRNQIVLLTSDGCVFGLGDNSLGELGLGFTDRVTKLTPLSFFSSLNKNNIKQFSDNFTHPFEKNSKQCNNDSTYFNDNSDQTSNNTGEIRYFRASARESRSAVKYIPNARAGTLPANRFNKC